MTTDSVVPDERAETIESANQWEQRALIAESLVRELARALQGLWHRHNDGSDEWLWAEWDTPQDTLSRIPAHLRAPETTSKDVRDAE